jgi:anti-sigma regulatory factor (Ser/Thr protein kinase)
VIGDDQRVTVIALGSAPGGADGFGNDLPLEPDLDAPIVVDARAVRRCHPMFVLRLRLFVDWHLDVGHHVSVIGPLDPGAAQHLADLKLGVGLSPEVVTGLPEPDDSAPLLGITRLAGDNDVEDAAQHAVEVLHRQTGAIAGWGDALHMGISELCDNAVHHGANRLGAYVAADRITEPRREFRLVIADLGIGIPEHIRDRYPEWQDDTAAIAQVLRRGVTSSDDPERGNGFSETIDYALEQQLVQLSSAVELDIRAATGRVGVHLIGGTKQVKDGLVTTPRRGTWISYTVVTA